MFLHVALLFSAGLCPFCWKMESIRRFFDADGSRCLMFYYQHTVKDDSSRTHAGKKDRFIIMTYR